MNVPCLATIASGAELFLLLSASRVAAEAQITELNSETELAIGVENPISSLMGSLQAPKLAPA